MVESQVPSSRLRAIFSRPDSGFSLIELIISMAILAIFMTILTTSIVSLSRASGSAQVVAKSANGILSVFQNLDRDVRYADSINYPGAGPSGIRYVEFRVPASSSPTGVTACTQWAYDPATQILKTRGWNDGSGSTSIAFSTKVSLITNSGTATTYPFQLVPATLTSPMQTLKFTIDAGTTSPTAGAGVDTVFVARNSSISSPSNSSSFAANVSDTPICQFTGSRP